MFIFKLIVMVLKVFSLPYRLFRMLFDPNRQDEEDARTLLDVLENYKDEKED